ncbi:MAG TPA: hypothetical protein VFZ93_02830 [Albitalea sp.]
MDQGLGGVAKPFVLGGTEEVRKAGAVVATGSTRFRGLPNFAIAVANGVVHGAPPMIGIRCWTAEQVALPNARDELST